MNPIVFIDTEIDPNNRQILDIGGIKADGSTFHKSSLPDFIQFLKGTKFICGHNILNHDIKYLGEPLINETTEALNIIDTLFLSPLLFSSKPITHY